MKDHRKDSGAPDNPETAAAREASTHPAADAGATGKMGAPPDTITSGDQKGAGLESTTRRPSLDDAPQDSYWRKSFAARKYTDPDRGYEYYRPAYRYGWEAGARKEDRQFDTVEDDLRDGWERRRTGNEPDWDEARPAIRDAWHRAGGETGETSAGNPLS